MFRPCKLCSGQGFDLKKDDKGVENKIVCEACSGTGLALIHIQNLYSKQLAASISAQNEALWNIRKMSYDLFSKRKTEANPKSEK